MADLKISQLTAATTPLAGTEVLPIVQSSTTVKVAVSDLTAGRAISATAATLSSGNLNFSSTAQRITGDFSNATVANRLAFQTSTTNGLTDVMILPNGSSTTARVVMFNSSSDPANASYAALGVISSEFRFSSSITGTGTYLPMTFYTGGSERMRVDTSGNVGIGTASPATRLHVLSAGDGTFNSQVIIAPAAGANPAKITFNPTVSSAIAGLTDGSVAFYGNGANTERMRIDSSGNVGIGRAPTAGYRLDVAAATAEVLVESTTGTNRVDLNLQNTSGVFSIGIDSSAGGVYGTAYSRAIFSSGAYPVTFWTASNERMRIDSSGNVGIGTASPDSKLAVYNPTGTTQIRFGSSSNYYWDISRDNDTTGNLWISNYNGSGSRTTRMAIDNSGNLTCAGVYSATVGATNRDVYVDDTGLIGYVSSIRASKTNIAPLSDTNWLLQLQPVTFNYRKKDDTGYTDEADGPQQYGLIAEDVEKVAPDLCYYDEVDGQQELRGINYSRLITPLLKLVQDQQDMIADLQIRLAKLEAKG